MPKLILSVMLAGTILLSARSPEVNFEITVSLDLPASGAEFFVEIPAGFEFIKFEPKVDLMAVTKTSSDGVWVGVFADYNILYSGSAIGVLTVRTSRTVSGLRIDDATAYRIEYSNSGDYEVAETVAISVDTAIIANIVPKPANTPTSYGDFGLNTMPQYGGYEPDSGVAVDIPDVELDAHPKSGVAETKRKTFDDINDAPWARKAIEYLAEYCGIKGMGDNKFRPNEKLTRAQYSRFISATLEIINHGTEMTFADVESDDWFYSEVAALFDAGVVTGYSPESFVPEEFISREQMAVMLLRAIQVKGHYPVSIRPFILTGDIDKASDYATPSIKTLYRVGIIEGTGGDYFEPHAEATRAEACVMLFRALNVIGRLHSAYS